MDLMCLPLLLLFTSYTRLGLCMGHPPTSGPLCPKQCNCQQNYTIINCARNRLKSIPSHIPQSVRELYLGYNFISTVPSNAFEGLSNLSILSLKGNLIVKVQDNAFDGLTSLKYLYLTNNKMKDLSKSATAALTSLRYIYLTNNQLIAVPDLGHMKQIIKIGLDNNALTSIRIPASFSDLQKLTTLTFSHNTIPQLDATSFKPLRSSSLQLRKIGLSWCGLKSVGNGTFSGLRRLQSLVLSYNDLRLDGVQNIVNSLQDTKLDSLDLSQSVTVTTLPTDFFQALDKVPLHKLFLRHNNIEVLQNGSFNFLKQVGLLDMSYSSLIKIEEGAFSGMSSLQTLLLYNNHLVLVPSSLPPNLLYLDLSQNAGIVQLDKDAFLNSYNLKNLTLSKCSIRQIMNMAFRGLTQLQYLDLSYNKIGGNNIGVNVFSQVPSLEVLVLSHNKLTDIGHEAKLFQFASVLVHLDMSHNSMYEIPYGIFRGLKNLMTLHLEGNSLTKKIKLDEGGDLFQGLQKLEILSLSRNGLVYLPSRLFSGLPSLKTLDTSHNIISQWGEGLFGGMKNLQHVDLHFNRITLINASSVAALELLTPNITLDLSDNPFDCFCDAVWFRNWLDRTNISMLNLAEYHCFSPVSMAGKPIKDFHPASIQMVCHPPIYIYIIVGAEVLLVIIIIIAIPIYVKRWPLRLWSYRRTHALPGRGYQRLPEEYHHLATISYIDDDLDIINNEILPALKKAHIDSQTIFFEEKDCCPNESKVHVLGKIVDAMATSYKVILLISREYLENARAQFELEQAIERCLNIDGEEGVSVPGLIVVVLVKQNEKEVAIRDKFPEMLRRVTKHEDIEIWERGNQAACELCWEKVSGSLQQGKDMLLSDDTNEPIQV